MNNARGFRGIWQRLSRRASARRALVVIGILIVAAIVGPSLRPHECHEQIDIVRLKSQPPSLAFPFGTDQFSRDVLARVLCGAQISLSVGIIAVLVAATIGTTLGLISGFFGGRVDAVMMRLLDSLLSIPRVLLLLAVLSLWQPVSLPMLIILLGTTGWFGLTRLVRAETLSAKQRDYVEAARALGASTPRILWRHLLPNIVGPMVVNTTLAVGNVIVLESGLSYLGVGAREPSASWGAMFVEGAANFANTWWVAFFPGVAIVATVLAFNVLGDALRDVLDPRQLPASFAPEPLENG